MTTRSEFASGVLAELQNRGHEAPGTTANIDGLVAQQKAENTGAEFNPMATTEPEPGASNFNPAGVKDYPSLEEGIKASVDTLLNGDYQGILDALATGNSAQNLANAWAHSPWGTEPFADFVAEVESNRNAIYGEIVPGSTPEEPAPSGAPELSIKDGAEENGTVRELQTFFNEDCGQHLAVDGYFGAQTEAAVRNFQIIMHLAVDGIVGPQTWEAINYVKALHGN